MYTYKHVFIFDMYIRNIDMLTVGNVYMRACVSCYVRSDTRVTVRVCLLYMILYNTILYVMLHYIQYRII